MPDMGLFSPIRDWWDLAERIYLVLVILASIGLVLSLWRPKLSWLGAKLRELDDRFCAWLDAGADDEKASLKAENAQLKEALRQALGSEYR